MVKYNYLGKSGLKVSNICLGTMTFGDSPVRFLLLLKNDLQYNENVIMFIIPISWLSNNVSLTIIDDLDINIAIH